MSLAAAEEVVERLRAAIESTGAGGFGGFAGLYPLEEGRFLVASTDGVGSKLVLSRRAGRLHDAGRLHERHERAHRTAAIELEATPLVPERQAARQIAVEAR